MEKRKKKNSSIAKAMPFSGRSNYKIGRDFEYRVIAFLRKHGYYCMRAYASKGLYDVIGIPPKNNDFHNWPLLIQAKKAGYVPPKEMEKLRDEKWQGWVLIAYAKNRKLCFRTLDGVEISLDALRLNQ